MQSLVDLLDFYACPHELMPTHDGMLRVRECISGLVHMFANCHPRNNAPLSSTSNCCHRRSSNPGYLNSSIDPGCTAQTESRKPGGIRTLFPCPARPRMPWYPVICDHYPQQLLPALSSSAFVKLWYASTALKRYPARSCGARGALRAEVLDLLHRLDFWSSRTLHREISNMTCLIQGV